MLCHFRSFVTRAHAGEDIRDICGLLVALASPDALCWIMSVMVSLMVSMSSSSCSVSNRFLSSSWNSIFFDPILVASTLCVCLVTNVFMSTSMSSLVLLITGLWLLPMLALLINVISVTMSGLYVRM